MIYVELFIFEKKEKLIVRVNEKSTVSDGIFDIAKCFGGDAKNSLLISVREKRVLNSMFSFERQNIRGGDTLIYMSIEEWEGGDENVSNRRLQGNVKGTGETF